MFPATVGSAASASESSDGSLTEYFQSPSLKYLERSISTVSPNAAETSAIVPIASGATTSSVANSKAPR
ncbi:MAG: hypothetical protein IJN32_08130 [Thermoguttaceae bacterium]|nr:hypothetical protein [Thermoguttaceae bacterium]